MQHTINIIPFANLSLAFVPVLAVIFIMYRWSLNFANALYAIGRMLVQLLLVGFVLAYIFGADNGYIVLAILLVMILMASWIALRMVADRRRSLYKKALLAIAVGGGVTLLLITQGVLRLDPWYAPRYMIPLAGMIFANAMNSVSLAAERVAAELDRDVDFTAARAIALRTSLIPIINSCFAVGIVSLPGMMTGQILSGVSPFIAARYQIMVMCMIFGAVGLTSAIFLKMIEPKTAVMGGESE